AAKAEKLQYRRRSATEVAQADFFAEEVRRNLMAAYGEKGLYEGGLTVSTTLDPAIQSAADNALRDGLIAYDRRHGWRGPYAKIPDMTVWEEEFARIVQRRPLAGPSAWQLAVVNKVEAQSVQLVGLPDGGEGTVPFAEMTWARPTLQNQTVGAAPRGPRDVVSVGDVIVVEKVEKPAGANAKPYPPKTYALRQVPNVEGGVVVMDTQAGRVLAMSGGWSYGRSQFNRAVQAARQPGSAFKPFVYLAAMDAGFTPASIVLDAPFVYDPGYGQPLWTPKNYGGDMLGPTTVRRGLELSRNLMTVRMAQQVGMKRVVEVAKEFGVTDQMGAYLPMALGAGETTLLRMTMAYAMLANGALEITPSLVDRVQDRNGRTVYRHEPRTCRGCGETPGSARPAAPELVDSRKPFHDPASVYQVVSMMQGVTTRGTAGRLAALGRPIAGKTGTTNDAHDNWFLGSTPDITIGVYIGFDEPRTLGSQETGGGNAAPIYEAIAREIFKGKPPTPFRVPPGLRMVRFSYEGGTIDEVFKPGTEPGSEGYMVTPLDGSAPYSAIDPTQGPQQAGSPRRPGLSGTGETY
ncbi:MAG: penicillin-binding transpeptidase domain-containing protein, partial [Reyranella sp.]|nr:penicillin-binding transpeptidase domain-containing protein [Reyranella sp.]